MTIYNLQFIHHFAKSGAKVLLFFELCKYFSLFLQKIFIYGKNVVPLPRILYTHVQACKYMRINLEYSRHTHMAKKILLLTLALGLSMAMSAQSFRTHSNPFEGGDDYHFGWVSGSVGYSMLQTRIPTARSHGGTGGSVGLGYEFRNSGLWVNMGLQLSFHRSSLTIDAYTEGLPGQDTQGKTVELIYRVNETDELQWNYIDVPIMVGYYYKGLYLGGGLKLSYAINPTTTAKGVYDLSGKYSEYSEPVSDQPQHGYTQYDFEDKRSNRLNVSASVIGEIGYDLLSSLPTSDRLCHVLKLGFYFEYCLNNQLSKWDTPQSHIEPIGEGPIVPATSVKINPYANTMSDPFRTVPFFTGVKLTYMIGSSRTARSGFHHGCMCYN